MQNNTVSYFSTSPSPSRPPASQDDDFSSLQLEELLVHKSWKARKTAYERVRDDPKGLKSYLLEKTKKVTAETNAAAQEALFEAFSALVDVCNEDELNVLATAPLKMVIEKGITGRVKAVQTSFKFVSDLVGAARHNEVFDTLLLALSHKTPKNRMAATQLCAQIIGDYGVQGLPLKSLLKSMLPLFNDSNAQVRKEAVSLCCECYKYIGQGIKGFLLELRDVQLQELETLFENIVPGQMPKKTIRGQTALSAPIKPVAPVMNLVNNTNSGLNDIGDAEYEMFDEMPVLSRLPRKFYLVALDKSAKWQDRVAMVQDNLLPLISAPKIRLKDDYHELVNMVREFLADPQAPLMLIGFKCVQELARALRAGFAPYTRSFLGILFEKMKDKKGSVLEHITTTLDIMLRYKCITLEQCQEDIENTAQSRVPNQKLALINWLFRLTDKLERYHFNRLIRAHNMFARLMNDEKTEVREASCVLIVKLITLFGETNFKPFFALLDDKQRAKLAAALNAATNTQSTPTCSPAKKTQRIERCEEGATPINMRMPMVTAAESGGKSRSSAKGQRGFAGATQQSHVEMQKQHLGDDAVALESTLPSKDEAFKQMMGLLPDELSIRQMLRSKEWSTRYSGIIKVREMVDGWSDKECTEHLNTVLVYLRVDPGWRESIFQVFQAMLGVFQELITRATTVSHGASYAIIAGCTCRLTESKNKPTIRELITCLVKKQGVSFVLRHLMEAVVAVKTPRLIQEGNEFMAQLLRMFSLTQSDAKSVVEYVKAHCSEIPTPAVRSSVIALLVATRFSAGPVVDSYMGNINHAVRVSYEESVAQGFEATTTAAAAAAMATETGAITGPLRISQDSKLQRSASVHQVSRFSKIEKRAFVAKGPSREDVTANNTGASQTDEMYTSNLAKRCNNLRLIYENEEGDKSVDVSQQFLQLAKQIKTARDWRSRLDAVKKVEELIYANNKTIPSNSVVEVLQALRSRFDEANKNFLVDVLRTVSLVMEAAGPAACRSEPKSILQGVSSMLGDQKAILREEAINVVCLTLNYLGLEPVIQCMLKPLTAESHICNQVALELIERGFQQDPNSIVSKQVVNSILPAVVRLCMSRIVDVRLAAENVIGRLLPIVGQEAIMRIVRGLRPAERESVMGTIERPMLAYIRSTSQAGGVGAEEDEMKVGIGAVAEEEEEGGTQRKLHQTRSVSQHSMSYGRQSLSSLSLTAQGAANTGKSADCRSAEPSPVSSAVRRSPVVVQKRASTATDGQSLESCTSALRCAGNYSKNEELLSIQEIMVGLRSASSLTATNTCVEFLNRLENGEDCGTPEMIQVMVERLYENVKYFEVDLALGLIKCLRAIFERPRCAQWCHSSLLFRMLGMIFDCLLSENFSLREKVIKALNAMTLKLLEGCPSNDVFSALMSRMTKYSAIYTETGKKSDLKYIQVTVKCLLRLNFEIILPDNIILCCHEYLLQHPPSAFRNLDDISIRTVKTMLQDLTRRFGSQLLVIANRLVGTQNLVTHFIRACLENQERMTRTNGEDNEQKLRHPEERSRQETSVSATNHMDDTEPQREGFSQAYSGSSLGLCNVYAGPHAAVLPSAMRKIDKPHCASPAAVVEERSIVGIFSRIRNHMTSNQGIEELYVYLKHYPSSLEFDQQFRRCSEAFRSYIKRKMERMMAEDPEKTPGFVLPDSLRSTV